ncbi:MAG: hypothetical protein HKO63_07305, partial [Acidimicrobiia bacterium]|nr:hypothetical protein [Acidimicrobiia bacterium]
MDDVPGVSDGYTARGVWTAERGVVYVLTGRTSPSYDSALWRYDHGSWYLELEVAGHNGRTVFGTGPDDIYTIVYPPTNDSRLFHFNGATWTEEALPPALESDYLRTIAGVPGDVQVGDGTDIARNTGSGWTVVPHDPAINVGPKVLTYVGPDEAYMASCWGHGRWDGVTWDKKVEFDFCDVGDLWGARTDAGNLNLWAVGTSNFQNGIRIWRYDEASRSFGAKYTAEVMDPPGTAHRTGQATGIWGSGPDDVYVSAFRWDSYPTDAHAVAYHYNGAGWTAITDFGTGSDLPLRMWDVWGTAPDDVWFVLEDGRLLHYTTPNTPPVAIDDAYTTAEGTLLTVGTPGVLGN